MWNCSICFFIQKALSYLSHSLPVIFVLYFRKQVQKSSIDNEGNDADADFKEDDDDDEFLSLDDVQEGKNLNLKEDFESRDVIHF